MGSIAAKRIVAAVVLCVAGAALSGLLLAQHHGEPGAVSAVSEVCGEAQASGCEDVARSPWSSLAGVPLAAYGLFFYLSLALALALALLGPADLRDPLAGIVVVVLALGLVVDLWLLGIQAFSIKGFCKLCIATYLLSAAAFAALFPAWRGLARIRSALTRADGRLALGGWALGSLAVIAAVAGANSAFGQRALRRQTTLLGSRWTPAAASAPASLPAPVPAFTPEPGPAPSGPEEAKRWRERAQALQQTLDDPSKLEAYFLEKARREYEASPIVRINLDDTPAKGPADAPVKVVEYSDFLCPFCRNLALGLSQFVSQAGNRLTVYFKNYPLDSSCNSKLKRTVHPGACNLALGAVCAQRQGKFESYHDKVFSTELRNPQAADVVRLAGEAGLNAAAMQGCLNDPLTKEVLNSQIEEANRLEVSSTPTVYVNNRKLPSVNFIVAIVDKEAQKKGMPPLGK